MRTSSPLLALLLTFAHLTAASAQPDPTRTASAAGALPKPNLELPAAATTTTAAAAGAPSVLDPVGGGLAATATRSPSAAALPGSRRYSWTALFDPRGQRAVMHAELGFARLPMLTLHLPVREGLSVGAAVGFGFAGARPDQGFAAALHLAVPVRWTFPWAGFQFALRGDPGVRIGDGFTAISLSAEGSVGFELGPLIVGGGVAVPTAIVLGAGRGLVVPILFGPQIELRASPAFALTLDMRAGPHLATQTGFGLGLRALGGVAIRL